MSDEGLYRLYKLHLLDAKLHSLKSRAAGLDTGQKEAALYNKLQADSKSVRDKAKNLRQQLTDLQNKRVSNDDTKNRHEARIYDGSITNPKELQDLTREVKELGEQDGKIGRQIEELKPLVEAAEAEAADSQEKMAQLKAIVLKKQEKAKSDHVKLHQAYDELKPKREAFLKLVDPIHLRAYEGAVKKTKGTGMALVTDSDRCESCGVPVPEKVKVQIRSGKAMNCENCRRVLFILVPDSE